MRGLAHDDHQQTVHNSLAQAVIPPELSRLREQIEHLDRALVQLIAHRVRIAREAGTEKLAAGLPTQDPDREAEVIRQAIASARDAGLDCDDEVRQIFSLLIELSRRAQSNESESPRDGV